MSKNYPRVLRASSLPWASNSVSPLSSERIGAELGLRPVTGQRRHATGDQQRQGHDLLFSRHGNFQVYRLKR